MVATQVSFDFYTKESPYDDDDLYEPYTVIARDLAGEIIYEETTTPDEVCFLNFTLNGGIHSVEVSGTSFVIDNVDIGELVHAPEPASMLLLGSGLVGMAAVGRKKFFKKA